MGLLLATVALVATVLQANAAVPSRDLAAAPKQPQTLYTSPSGAIDAFAQDGSLLAWFAPSAKGCNSVRLLSLANGAQVSLPDESPNARNVTCQWDVVPPVRLALAQADVLWTLRDSLSPLPFDYLLGAGSSDPRERRFQEIAHARGHGAGLWFGGLAGDSKLQQSKKKATLVYGVTAVVYVNEVACLSTQACAMKIDRANGGVYRIVGRKPPIRVPGTSSAIAVAVSGTSVAYIPTASVASNGHPLASPNLPVEVRDTRSGTLLASVVPTGTPLALALARDVLALLDKTKAGVRLTWYDATTGKPSGSVSVPSATNPELTASDQLIVFRVGRSIRAVNVATRRVTTLAEAASTPIGLSLEGTRLAWAENVGGRGRIRALFVGGRG
jgi:hypothetical protein